MSYKSSEKNIKKIIFIIIKAVIILTVLFSGIVFSVHTIKSNQEIKLLKNNNYYNPVSVGDYNLNVSKFGNLDGRHNIVGMAGLGSGDYSIIMRRMTACLETDNLVVFIDRAGYGLSDDTNAEMTIEYIVEDYRKALQNSGVKAPYILMPHSIGGAYATYWVSRYPDEIEAVIFIDGSQISENAFDDEDIHKINFIDRLLATLAKTGLSRLVIRDYNYLLPEDVYSETDQIISDALAIRTLDSVAPVCESRLIAENSQKAFNEIVKNDVPKLYISSSWGIDNWNTMSEYGEWLNKMIEKNNLNMPLWKDTDDEAKRTDVLDSFEKIRQDVLYPYLEKMGNCQYVALGGDHFIFMQKPLECAKIIKDFIKSLE